MAFEAMTRDELKKLADRNNIYIPSKYNKEDMIETISEFFNKKKKRDSKRLSMRSKRTKSPKTQSIIAHRRSSVRNMNYAPINYAPINYAPVNYNNIVNNYYSAPEIKEIAKINKIKTPADANKKELIEIVNAVLNDRLRNKSPIKMFSPKVGTPHNPPGKPVKPKSPLNPQGKQVKPKSPYNPQGKQAPKSPQKQQAPKSPQKQQAPKSPYNPQGKQAPKSPQKQQAPKSPQGKQAPKSPQKQQGKAKSPTPKKSTITSPRSKSPKVLDKLPPLQPAVPFSEVSVPAVPANQDREPKFNRNERRELERKERKEREEKAKLEREAKDKLEEATSKLEQDIQNEVSEKKIEKDIETIENIEEEIKDLKKSKTPASPKIFTPRRKQSPDFVLPDIPVFEPIVNYETSEKTVSPFFHNSASKNELNLAVLPIDQSSKVKNSKVRSLPRIIGPKGEQI